MGNTAAVRIGQRVKHLREEARLTQSELARRAFISRSYVTHIETGRNVPSYEVLGDLADALGQTRAALDPDSDVPPSADAQDRQIALEAVGAIRGVPVQFVGRFPADNIHWTESLAEGRNVNVPREWLDSRPRPTSLS